MSRALQIMAIVNRTPDSFYDRGATFAFDAAMRARARRGRDGADIVDIGGVKAGAGDEVDIAEEIARTPSFVAAVRDAYPDLSSASTPGGTRSAPRSVRAGATCSTTRGADLIPTWLEVAAEYGAGLVCTHAGGVTPRTRPHRIEYEDVVADVLRTVVGLAERAAALGVPATGS